MTAHRIDTTWIPAHPVYGSVSMTRYWKLLEAAIRPDDSFACASILPADAGEPPVTGGQAQRFFTRKLLYPITVKMRAKGDLVHILDHSWADLLPYAPRKSLRVVTVHDLIPLRFPGELSAAQVHRFRGWVTHLSQADAIIAVSAYTKREVETLLGIDGAKIHVVFNGVELPDAPSGGTGRVSLPGHLEDARHFRIGSIGSTLARKNLGILPAALARLQASIQRKVVLVRVGTMLPASLAAELRLVLGDAGLIELGHLPDPAIGEYYAGLDAVVIPSLYEGFGLPVIEGMAARVPVIASRSTSLPEVGGDLAFYFDPGSPEELAEVLTRVARDGVSARQLDAGFERAKSLSWRKCLEGVYQVYQEALERRRNR
jgi:alpha-1,3-rhamnosyl/mannosyltransferase